MKQIEKGKIPKHVAIIMGHAKVLEYDYRLTRVSLGGRDSDFGGWDE